MEKERKFRLGYWTFVRKIAQTYSWLCKTLLGILEFLSVTSSPPSCEMERKPRTFFSILSFVVLLLAVGTRLIVMHHPSVVADVQNRITIPTILMPSSVKERGGLGDFPRGGGSCGRGCQALRDGTEIFFKLGRSRSDLSGKDLLAATDQVIIMLEEMGIVYSVASLNLSGNAKKLRNAGAETVDFRLLITEDAELNRPHWDPNKTQPSCARPDSPTCASLWLIRTLQLMRHVVVNCGIQARGVENFRTGACARKAYEDTLGPLHHQVWRTISLQVLSHTPDFNVIVKKFRFPNDEIAFRNIQDWSDSVDRTLLKFGRIEKELWKKYGKELIR